jgi:hypothetical protein
LILILVWLLLLLFVFPPKETERSTLAYNDNFVLAQPSLNIPENKMTYFDGIYVKAPTSPVGVSPVEYLRSLAGDDFVLLYEIAKCESNWNPKAQNPNSTAKGIFQFLSSTWQAWGKGEVLDPFANIEAAVRLYNSRGTGPWLASIDCWK